MTALLTNEVISGQNDGTATPVLYRYTDGTKTWKVLLGGSGIDSDNELASPDINGDLVYSSTAGYYAAYIVVTSTSGSASGHYGDAIRYITTDGTLKTISGASSSWGCSHNTGIAFEEADAPPFASLCAEDQGAIWLNTKTQGMTNDGVKVSNEHVINGASNEPMGGMSGSYSVLARFQDANSYIFSWVSRGAIDLTENTWMGDGYTTAENRTNNRNIAVALFSDKNTLVGDEAISTVGAEDGDSQVNWLTSGSNDCSNAHVATFDSSTALVSWEEISNPICDFDAMGCRGTYAGTKFQLVTSSGTHTAAAISSKNVYVAGDMVTMSDGRICWPYVSMTWDLSGPVTGTAGKKMSFACMTNGSGTSSGSSTTAAAATSSAAAKTATSAAATTVAAVKKTTTAAAAAATKVTSSVQAAEESSVADTTTTLPSDAPRPSLVTLSSDVDDVLVSTTASSSKASSAASSAAAVTSAASSAAAVQSSGIVTSVVTPSQPTSTSASDDDDCDDEEPTETPAGTPIGTPVGTPVGTPPAETPAGTRTQGIRTRTRRVRPTGVSGASGQSCGSGKTVTETVYVTATPEAAAWPWK